MAQVVKETPTSSQIPQFVPFGELYYAQDTGDLWIGTGFSAGSDFTPGNPGPNVNIELVSSPGGSPGGFSGDIQYNNGGVLGGSAATVDALGNIVALTLTSTTVTSTAFDFLGVLVDTTGTVGASGQFLETTSTGVKWATVAAGGSTWAALTGDMTSTQVAPWDGSTPGTPDTGLSRVSAGVVGVGTGAATSTAGSLIVTTATVSSTLYGGVYWSGSSVGLSETGTALTSITTLGGLVISTSDVSDERLKEGTPYAGGLDTVLAIHPMRYKWNTLGEKETGISHGRPTIGFYAQDVQKAIPEAVWESRNGYLGFDSRPVIAALVNAVKELTARVKQLEATA